MNLKQFPGRCHHPNKTQRERTCLNQKPSILPAASCRGKHGGFQRKECQPLLQHVEPVGFETAAFSEDLVGHWVGGMDQAPQMPRGQPRATTGGSCSWSAPRYWMLQPLLDAILSQPEIPQMWAETLEIPTTTQK